VIREVLKVLAVFNWFTPVEIVVRGGAKIMVPEGGCSGGQAVKILMQHGIQTHGWMVVNSHYMFYVSPNEAERAREILKSKGVVVI